MIVDPNVPIQVSRSPEGAVSVHLPAGSVDWAGLIKTVLPMMIKIVEQILESRSESRSPESVPMGQEPPSGL